MTYEYEKGINIFFAIPYFALIVRLESVFQLFPRVATSNVFSRETAREFLGPLLPIIVLD